MTCRQRWHFLGARLRFKGKPRAPPHDRAASARAASRAASAVLVLSGLAPSDVASDVIIAVMTSTAASETGLSGCLCSAGVQVHQELPRRERRTPLSLWTHSAEDFCRSIRLDISSQNCLTQFGVFKHSAPRQLARHPARLPKLPRRSRSTSKCFHQGGKAPPQLARRDVPSRRCSTLPRCGPLSWPRRPRWRVWAGAHVKPTRAGKPLTPGRKQQSEARQVVGCLAQQRVAEPRRALCAGAVGSP